MADARQLREYTELPADTSGTADVPALDVNDFTGGVTDHTVWSCAGNLTAVRSIRARVREFLARAGHTPQILDDAELAASELATNALLHSRSGQIGGVMTLYIRSEAGWLRVAIADQGEKRPAEPDGAEPRADEGDYGRGKLIVDSCATRSGEYWTEAAHVVWFEIDDTVAGAVRRAEEN